MTVRKTVAHVAALAALILLATSVSAVEAYAPQAIAAAERCPVCGMYPANYPQWHAQIVFKDGGHSSFDSPADMFRFLLDMAKYDKRHTSAEIGKTYVTEHQTGGWLDARAAFFVAGSKAQGPMGPDLPAFASKEKAAEFAKSAGGEVFGFEQVTLDVVNGRLGGHSH